LSAGGTLAGADLLEAGDRYYASQSTTAPLPALAAGNLVFNVAPSSEEGEEEAAGDMGAGEFWIWTTINRKRDRTLQA